MARPSRSDTEYQLKVKLKSAKRIWRLIALRGDQTLDDLHEAIFEAFDRFDAHLYSFYFPKAPRRPPPEGPVPWWHEVRIEQIGPVVSGRRYPEIIEKHGRSPAQYGDDAEV